MCFVGHGAFGIITKQVWCNYFAVFGIGERLAYQLMPVVGLVDIVLGLSLLVYPVRAVAAWLVFWGLFTALLRPLSGEPFAEFLERAGNYGAPLVLLILLYTRAFSWFQKTAPFDTIDKRQLRTIVRSLQWIGFILLAGHGWLNVIGKAGLLKQYASIGFENPESIAQIIGIIEILGAASLVLFPLRSVILILFIWKLVSETQYTAFPILEWVERGGSYAILLVLWIVLKNNEASDQAFRIVHRVKKQMTFTH
jgi:hypothetical protein